jgi:hypothetical protein
MSQQDLEYYGERRIQRAVDDLTEQFHGIWSRETIDRFVRECQDSQMAAALTHHLSTGRIGVRSAGSMPGEEIHANVVQAMLEVGLDVHEDPRRHRPPRAGAGRLARCRRHRRVSASTSRSRRAADARR